VTFFKTDDVLVISVQYVTWYTICILVLLSLFPSLEIRHPDVCATLFLSFYFLHNLTATLHQTYDIYPKSGLNHVIAIDTKFFIAEIHLKIMCNKCSLRYLKFYSF